MVRVGVTCTDYDANPPCHMRIACFQSQGERPYLAPNSITCLELLPRHHADVSQACASGCEADKEAQGGGANTIYELPDFEGDCLGDKYDNAYRR